ncbi:MAG: radical SAM-associated putative lipoprotein [Bacteroidetes bacterium]|nr:radical SAM-associated putative lipoprotein [Bacteroidota bacterium]
MKKFNHFTLKTFNAILAALLGLLGFSNCSAPCEYGTPEATYILKGKVTNKADKKPIKGIFVGFKAPRIDVEYGVPQTEYNSQLPTYTDENGNFQLQPYAFPGIYDNIDSLYVYDLDGVENGGYFTADTIFIDWKNAVKTKRGSGWYEGEFTLQKDIELSEDKSVNE